MTAPKSASLRLVRKLAQTLSECKEIPAHLLWLPELVDERLHSHVAKSDPGIWWIYHTYNGSHLERGPFSSYPEGMKYRSAIVTHDMAVSALKELKVDTFISPIRYTVSIFPEWMRNSDDSLTVSESNTWSLTVEWRGQKRWGVFRTGMCLGSDGEWDYDSPASREDEWIATHRFDLDTALKLAAEQAPLITINGYTALEVLHKHEQRHQKDHHDDTQS